MPWTQYACLLSQSLGDWGRWTAWISRPSWLHTEGFFPLIKQTNKQKENQLSNRVHRLLSLSTHSEWGSDGDDGDTADGGDDDNELALSGNIYEHTRGKDLLSIYIMTLCCCSWHWMMSNVTEWCRIKIPSRHCSSSLPKAMFLMFYQLLGRTRTLGGIWGKHYSSLSQFSVILWWHLHLPPSLISWSPTLKAKHYLNSWNQHLASAPVGKAFPKWRGELTMK